MSNKYEYTRTISFVLKNAEQDSVISRVGGTVSRMGIKEVLDKLVETYGKLLSSVEKTVYRDDKTEKIFNPKLEINYKWIRRYAKEEYDVLTDKTPKKYTKAEARFLSDIFIAWLEENRERLEELKKYVSLPNNEHVRLSDINLLTRGMFGSDCLSFASELTVLANDKDNDDALRALKTATENFRVILEDVRAILAPNQSRGYEIARGSFNYYTINKVSKNFDKDIEKYENQLNEKYTSVDGDFLDRVGFSEFIKPNTIKDIPMEALYENLKKYKSQQKKEFNEAVQRGDKPDVLSQKFPLFNGSGSGTLQKFIDTTQEKRGRFYQYEFKNYKNYCEIYKKVAMKRGGIKAGINAIEQEKADARLLKYWGHILKEANGKFSLILIPKEKAGEAKQFAEGISSTKKCESILYSFNSLTLRALEKLIRRNLGREIQNFNKEFMPVYKAVLNGKHNKIVIDLSGFKEEVLKVAKREFKSENDFRIAMEKVAYFVKETSLSNQDIMELKEKYSALVYPISSADMARNITGEKKEHTKLWDIFWQENNKDNFYPTRLNPEFRIFYRNKIEQLNPKKQKNRFTKEQYTVALTVTQNASTQRMETAFADEKDLPKMVKKFNNDVIGNFVKKKADNLYYYGIDRGQQELATLCVVRFSQEKYEVMLADGTVKQFDKPVFPPIETYRIKDEYLHEEKEIVIDSIGKKIKIEAYKNPSYFIIDDKDIFEQVNTPFIDLTTAKLIKGKIILNGDMQTYIKLKETNAKRQLLEKFSKIDTNSKVEFDETKKRFQVKSKTGEKEQYQFLPYYRKEQEKISSRDEFQGELQDYLDKLRNGTSTKDISIEKINHLRDAITSNMVGIIAFLFEKYPGIINLENMHSKEHIERHFQKSNENIARRLEWSLYKKFQKIGLVPPKLRQTVFLHDPDNKTKKAQLNQFGIIHFIPIEKTSANCPRCGIGAPMKQRDEDKFKHHVYICGNNQNNCGFDTRNSKHPLELIKNSDQVAAYNIAKHNIAKENN